MGGTWEIILSITQKSVEKWRWNLYTALNVVKEPQGGKVFSGFIRPAIKRKENPRTAAKGDLQNNRIKTVRLKKHAHTHAATVTLSALVRWQVVLVFLSSSVALCCPSLEKEGSFLLSVYFFFFFLYPVDPVTGARASYCVWAVRRPRPKRALSLSLRLSWNGHGQFTWRHTLRNKR